MANSLGFLNKPAPTKPATSSAAYNPLSSANAGSKPAPKAFLDKSNPWAVGGAPAPKPQPAPARTPAKKTPTPTPQRQDIPSRGYNYTDASYTGATPQQRAREVDQAQMAAQATRQRREREAQQAQAAAQPQAAAYRPPANQAPLGAIQPQAYLQPVAAAAQLAQEAWEPATQAVQGFMSPLMRRLNSWMTASGQGGDPYLRQQQGVQSGQPMPPTPTPQPYDDAFMRQQRGVQPGQPMPPTPTPANYDDAFMRQQRGVAQPPAPAWSMPVFSLPGMPALQPAQPQLVNAPTPEGARAAANAAQPQGQAPAAPKAPAPAQPATLQYAPEGTRLYYGYAIPPGELQVPGFRDYPKWTALGAQAFVSDNVVAAREGYRRRQAGLEHRPWSSYTDAEKYQLRFGVMPTGPQMMMDNRRALELQAAARAQTERLNAEYWAKYGERPLGGRTYLDEAWERNPVPMIQMNPSGAVGAAAPAAQAPQATQNNQGGVWQPQAPQKEIRLPQAPAGVIDNTLRLQTINPDMGAVQASNVQMITGEILKRWRPDINPDNMSINDISLLLLSNSTAPPAGQEEQFYYDMEWVKALRGE